VLLRRELKKVPDTIVFALQSPGPFSFEIEPYMIIGEAQVTMGKNWRRVLGIAVIAVVAATLIILKKKRNPKQRATNE
jgi:hypothetical protein